MDIKHQSLVLDINETRNYTFIKACQGDQKSRYIDCTLTQNGSVLRLTSNYRAIVKASINNEVKAINSCTIDTTSQVIVVELTSIMLDTPGILNCEITVQDGQQIVTSQAFAVQVRQSTIANETEIKKSKEYGALVDALSSIADVESKADKVQGLVDNIDKLESANDIINRLSTSEANIEANETSIKKLSELVQEVKNSAIAELEKKENLANKVNEILFPSTDFYPSSKAVWDYVTSKLSTPLSDIEILKADFNSYKTSNDNAVNSKVDTTDFNTYKTATDKAIADNTKSIKANTTAIDKCVPDIAINSALINQNSIKATTDKSTSIVLNDSSDCNIASLTLYGKSTQSAVPSPTNPVDIKDINNPKITVTNDSDSQSINIQCTLRGIGNVCDTLTVNSDGTGYITQRLFVERITSQRKSTSFEWNYSKTTNRFFRNDYSYSFDVKDNKPLILCSHLDVGENEKNTAFDNSIGWINVGGVGIAIRMTEFDGDIAKFKKWLDDNEVYVVAPRSKPITLNLSKDEVDKILSLHTYYPSTKISADTDFEVTYIANTKNYIDNKILEVATALVASESEVM